MANSEKLLKKTVPYSSAAGHRGPGAVWAKALLLSLGPYLRCVWTRECPGDWASGPGEPGAPRAESLAAQPLPGVCPQYRHRPPGPDFLAHSFMDFLSSWACQAVVTLAFHVTVDPSAPGPGPPAGWALSPPSPQSLPVHVHSCPAKLHSCMEMAVPAVTPSPRLLSVFSSL